MALFNNQTKKTAAAPANNPSVNSDLKNVKIDRYQDLEGVKLEHIRVGIWFLEHKQYFLYGLYGLLIFIGLLTWPRFFYVFGEYIFIGMRNEAQLLSEMTQTTFTHEQFLSQSAQPLQFGAVEILPAINGKVDLVASVRNPNPNFAAEYSFYFTQNDIKTESQTAFILPQENKYLMALNLEAASPAAGWQVLITNIHYRRIDAHVYRDWKKFAEEHLVFEFIDKKFIPASATLLTEKIKLNDLQFTAVNNSAFNYQELNLQILLWQQSRLVGANHYLLERFGSGDRRDIKITWPGRIDSVSEIVILPEVNILRDDIYFRFEGRPESTRTD
jgi:hypothetical protein